MLKVDYVILCILYISANLQLQTDVPKAVLRELEKDYLYPLKKVTVYTSNVYNLKLQCSLIDLYDFIGIVQMQSCSVIWMCRLYSIENYWVFSFLVLSQHPLVADDQPC